MTIIIFLNFRQVMTLEINILARSVIHNLSKKILEEIKIRSLTILTNLLSIFFLINILNQIHFMTLDNQLISSLKIPFVP